MDWPMSPRAMPNRVSRANASHAAAGGYRVGWRNGFEYDERVGGVCSAGVDGTGASMRSTNRSRRSR
jgi:hypothetical protein